MGAFRLRVVGLGFVAHTRVKLCSKLCKNFKEVRTWPIGLSTDPSGRAVCGRSLAAIVGSNPTGAWMFFSCECCVLSGRGLCDGLITCPGSPIEYDVSN